MAETVAPNAYRSLFSAFPNVFPSLTFKVSSANARPQRNSDTRYCSQRQKIGADLNDWPRRTQPVGTRRNSRRRWPLGHRYCSRRQKIGPTSTRVRTPRWRTTQHPPVLVAWTPDTHRLHGSARHRLHGSARRRLHGSARRRLHGSARHRLHGSARHRQHGSARHRLRGSARRRLHGSARR